MMGETTRMMGEGDDYAELFDPTVEMESPFQPAPLGDTVIMEHAWAPEPEDAAS